MSVQLPLPAMPKAVEGVTEIMCVCKGDRPFHVVVATQRYVHLVDLRQPAEPLLTQLHHLMQPPASVNLLHNVEEASIHIAQHHEDWAELSTCVSLTCIQHV